MNQTTLHQDIADAGGYVPKDGEEFFRMTVPDASGGRGCGAFALEDGNLLMATGLAVGPAPLASNKPKSHLTIPMQNGAPFHSSSPRADILGDDGKGTHSSLTAIQSASRCGDYGWLCDLVRSGALVPDCKIRGVGAWTTGPSAEKATATVSGLWSKHQATLQDNRKIQTGHRL